MTATDRPFTGTPAEVATLDRLWDTYAEELVYPNAAFLGLARLGLFFTSVGEPMGRAMLFQLRVRLLAVSMDRMLAGASKEVFTPPR